MKSNIIDKALKLLDIKKTLSLFILIFWLFSKRLIIPERVWEIIYSNYKDKTIIMPAFTFLINKKKSDLGL